MRRSAAVIAILALFILPFALVAGGVISAEIRRWFYVIAGIAALFVCCKFDVRPYTDFATGVRARAGRWMRGFGFR